MSTRTAFKGRRGLVAALVMGTALSSFGAAPADAAECRAIDDVTRYCNACWRNARVQPDAWSDCTQDVFERLLQRVDRQRWPKLLARDTEENREFLRAIDTVKKRTQRAHRPAPLAADIADVRGTGREGIEQTRTNVLAEARRHLTNRQAQIIRLSLDGWSVAEIAGQLGASPVRVSDEKYKAIRKLRDVCSG